jgi:hypothetical protein
MFKGSCCCGAIEFEISCKPIIMGKCHCSRCRKIGCSTILIVKKESFKFIKGADQCATYRPENAFKYLRNFCKNCGTSLGEPLSLDSSFPISANCIDEGPTLQVEFHEFVTSKPEWAYICDSAKQFPGHPTKE